ncbi:MAG: hypothetical protein AAF975_05700 [Spirochaetota bacterium]
MAKKNVFLQLYPIHPKPYILVFILALQLGLFNLELGAQGIQDIQGIQGGGDVPQETGPTASEVAPGLDREQPARRSFRSPDEGNDMAIPGTAPQGQRKPEEIQPSTPYPPYPNYPESRRPRPQRAIRQQEYLYLNHLYFEPLTMFVGGFISFGWLGMVGPGKALRLGLDLYNAGTNISLIVQGKADNDKYQVTAILLRLGFHLFVEPTQLKGFEVGFDLRSGILVLPASGNAIAVQATLELPLYYRFVISFYSKTGNQTLNFGFAPYLVLNIGGYLATSSTVKALKDRDNGFDEYLKNGNLFFEPSFINFIDPIALKFGIRFGFDVSFVF